MSLCSSNLINYLVNWGNPKQKRTFVSMKIKLIAVEKLNEGKFPKKIIVKLDSSGGDKCKRLRRGMCKSENAVLRLLTKHFRLKTLKLEPQARHCGNALHKRDERDWGSAEPTPENKAVALNQKVGE